MAGLGPVKLGLALSLVFFAIVVDRATSDEKCRTGCAGVTPRDFKFAEGTTYKYNYEGNIDISVSSAEGQRSTTKVRALVLLTQLPQCNQILRIQNLQVIGPDAKKYTNIVGIAKPVKLNFHDGHVEDVICADAGDTQNSLNIKRAVASMLQAAYKHSYETDVFGVCPTEFSTHKEGQTFVVKKTRNLNRCAQRESLTNDFLATAFNSDSQIKTSPLLKGEYSSEQRIKNGILDHVIVTESYLFVPFSAGSDGAKAHVQSKLTLAGHSKEAPTANVNVPVTIVFENPSPLLSDTINVNTILKAVKETAESIDVTVGDSSAGKFSHLVRVLRAAKKADLLTVYNQVRAGAGFADKAEAKQIFLDALFRAGTGDAIEVAIDLYQKKQLTDLETKLFFLGLSFVKHVTPNALKVAAGLVNAPDLPREGYLGVGILVNRFCRSRTCKNVPELNALLNALLSKINVKTVNDRKAENAVVAALKAIANTKHVPDNLATKIIALAQDKNGPSRIRVAALEAYLGNPCSDKFRDSALNVLKDVQQDSEIRIKAYLALVQCPNAKVANALKHLLDDEPSYQVGGFIVSHLRTLRTTANSDKAQAKAQLGAIDTTKKYPFNRLQYSFNEEVSYTFDTFGVGGSVESNVIFSQKSFLPRSQSLNLTAEIFGHTFNFLEIDVRQENLDKLVEQYFGPLGVLRKESPSGLVAKGKESWSKLGREIAERLKLIRTKRDVSKAQIDYIARQLQGDKQNALNKDLDLDVSVKLFGSEALFLSLNEDSAKYTPEAVVHKIFDVIDEKVAQAKNFDEIIRSNAVFLDAEVAYPTGLGFPLRLDLEGTSTVQIKTAGNVNVDALLAGKDDKFKFSLIPSANVQVASRFTLDAALVQAGLKVVANLHSATGASLDVEITDSGDGLEVKLAMPVDKQQIVTVTHDVMLETRDLGGPEVDSRIKFAQSKDFTVCVDHLSAIIGLTFCAEINQPSVAAVAHVPVLPYPLNGNSKLSVYVEKNDLAYFRFRERDYLASDKLGVELSIEAVGEQNKRKFSVQTEAFLKPEVYCKTTLESEVKKATVEGRLVNSASEKSVFAKVVLDTLEYYGKVGALVSGSKQRQIYRPVIEFKVGQEPVQKSPYNVEGQIVVEPHGEATKYTFDNLRLILPDQKPIAITGTAQCQPKIFSSDLTLSDSVNSGSFKGLVQLILEDFKVNAELRNTINPRANFNVKYELKQEDYGVASNLQVIHGQDLASKQNIFKLSNSIEQPPTKGERPDTIIKNHLSYPAAGVDATFDVEVRPRAVKYDVDFSCRKIKVGSELDLVLDKKTPGDLELEFELYGFDNKLEVDLEREVNGYKSRIKHKVAVNGRSLEVAGTVNHLVQNDNVNVGSDLTVKLTGHPDMKYTSGYKHSPGEVDAFVKLTSGGAVYVDVFYKANKADDGNGNLKLNFNGVLVANGQVRVTKGKGSGNIVVELPKYQRKIKSESTFTVHDPTYNLDLTFYPDFERDNSRKYTLSTHNQIKPDSIDTKNVVDFVGKKLEANFKGGYKGDLLNGEQQAEFDVTLPSQFYVAGKLDRNVNVVKNVVNGDVSLSLEQRDNKNTSGRKFTLKGAAKDTNFQDEVYDISYSIAGDCSSGKNLNVDLTMKGKKQGDKSLADWKVKAYGSVLPEALESSFNSETTGDLRGDHKVNYKYGKIASLDVNGKYDIDDAGKKPCTGSLTVALLTPNAKIRTLRFKTDGSVLLPQSSKDHAEVKASAEIFIDDDGTEKGATLDVKTGAEIKAGQHDGHLKGKFSAQNLDPIAVTAGYTHEEKGESRKCKCDLSVEYGAGKAVKADLVLARPNAREYDLNVALQTPHEKVKTTGLQVRCKKSEDGKNLDGEVVLKTNDDEYVLTSALVLSEHTPAFDFQLRHPGGKVDKLIGKVTKVGEKSFGGDLKVVYSEKNFDFDGSIDVKAEDIDDFSLKLAANSAALKLDKVVLTANTKDAKGGNKKIQFSAKAADKNVLSGFTTYKTREEGGKFVIEGSGNFKVKDESKSGNFKYIRQNIDNPLEKGVEISFDAALGNKAVDSEFKVTNKHFRILNSYCEEKKQCAHFEVDAKTTYDDVDSFGNVVEVNVDLRKLGLSHELGLKAVTTRKAFELDHTVDVHFQSQENKYQYSLYVHPKNAGLSLTTPKRVVSVEANVKLPPSGQVSPISGEILLYLNKKAEPNKKTALTFLVDNQVAEHAGRTSAKATLSHPALKKPLSLSYSANYDETAKKAEFSGVVDIFPGAKVIKVTGKSQGTANGGYGASANVAVDVEPLGYKYEANEAFFVDFKEAYTLKYDAGVAFTIGGEKLVNSVTLKATPKDLFYQLKLNNREVVGIRTNMQISKEAQIVDTQLTGLGFEPVSSHLEVKNLNRLTYNVYRTANPSDKLEATAALIPGQIAEVKVYVTKGGAKTDLARASVKLDKADFLKSDYAVSSEEIKRHVFAPARAGAENLAKEANAELSKSVEEAKRRASTVNEHIKQNAPDFKPVADYYVSELTKLKEEIVADKSLKEISESLSRILGAVAQVVADMAATINKMVEEVAQALSAQYAVLAESFEKDFLPQLKRLVDEVGASLLGIFESATTSVLVILEQIVEVTSDVVELLVKSFYEIKGTVATAVNDLVVKPLEEIKATLSAEWTKLIEEIKALPLYEDVKNAVQEWTQGLSVPEIVVETVRSAAAGLKDLIGLDEFKRAIDLTTEYIEKKLKRERVDDIAEIQAIMKAYVLTARKILSQLEEADFIRDIANAPSAANLAYAVPKLVAAKFSPINRLLGGEFPDVQTILYSVDFNPRSWIIPYRLHALIIQGQHIFTFDGKHLTFPGKCNYLLARDTVNDNFTIAGTYTNGLLASITVVDKMDAVTIKKNGQVLVNNAAAEFPVRRTLLDAYRTYDTVNVVSKAGARVTCSPDLLACMVVVSGFYHGQVKGLLGNGNHEAYDDFVLPNGKIVTSESDFGNAYKMQANCPAVKTVDHGAHHRADSCTALFGDGSDLELCYSFVDPENYRQACDHGVAAGVADTEKYIAGAYVTACRLKFIPVDLPDKYLSCSTDGDQTNPLGDKFSVKTPQKSADIVIAIDVVKENEPVYKELVATMVQGLTKELSDRGIKDVEYHVITYGGDNQKYPSHVTTNGGKMSFKGKVPTLKFSNPPEEFNISEEVQLNVELLNVLLALIPDITNDFNLALGNTVQAKAYEAAVDYPFRTKSVKAMIAVTGSPCEEGSLVLLQMLRAYLVHDETISLHLVTPMNDEFKVKDDKTTRTVIGFNENHLLTFPECRKKPLGNKELRGELVSHDYCVDFTVRSGGNVFVTNNFLAAKGPNRKLFTSIAAYNIAETLATEEKGLDCECERVNAYVARNKCTVAKLTKKPPTGRKIIMRG